MKLIFLFLCSLVLGSDFDLFMGKNTKHWAHLQQEEELELLYRFKEVYEKKELSLLGAIGKEGDFIACLLKTIDEH